MIEAAAVAYAKAGCASLLYSTGIEAREKESVQAMVNLALLTGQIGKGQPGNGFVQAIAAVGEHLARHFPPQARDEHALSNHLIVLPPA